MPIAYNSKAFCTDCFRDISWVFDLFLSNFQLQIYDYLQMSEEKKVASVFECVLECKMFCNTILSDVYLHYFQGIFARIFSIWLVYTPQDWLLDGEKRLVKFIMVSSRLSFLTEFIWIVSALLYISNIDWKRLSWTNQFLDTFYYSSIRALLNSIGFCVLPLVLEYISCKTLSL